MEFFYRLELWLEQNIWMLIAVMALTFGVVRDVQVDRREQKIAELEAALELKQVQHQAAEELSQALMEHNEEYYELTRRFVNATIVKRGPNIGDLVDDGFVLKPLNASVLEALLTDNCAVPLRVAQ